MENEVYEKDYRSEYEKRYPEEVRKNIGHVGDLIQESGIMHKIGEYYNSLPKIVNQQDKRDYEYLLKALDAVALDKGGTIRGEISWTNWEATIIVQLPFFELTNDIELLLLKDLSERCDMMNIEATDDGRIRLYVHIRYFEELTDQEEINNAIEQQIHQVPELVAEFERQQEEMKKEAYSTYRKFKEIIATVKDIQANTGKDEEEAFAQVWNMLLGFFEG